MVGSLLSQDGILRNLFLGVPEQLGGTTLRKVAVESLVANASQLSVTLPKRYSIRSKCPLLR